MIGAVLLAHLVGDYLIQSDWMANEKTKKRWPAVAHGVTYGLPFLLITQSPAALLIIVGTHVIIDRYRLARYAVWISNLLAPREYRYPWSECSTTGFSSSRPEWLAVWLLFIIDNTLHLLINVGAIAWIS